MATYKYELHSHTKECDRGAKLSASELVHLYKDAGYDGIVINPGAYTHTSIAILDAVKAVGVPTVEVHISDVNSREDFRRISYIRAACKCTISGKGTDGYLMAIDSLMKGE